MYFPVKILSVFVEILCPIVSVGFETKLAQRFSMKVKRISAKAASLSSPESSSSSFIMWSQASISFLSSPNESSVIWSFSVNFVAAKRVGI